MIYLCPFSQSGESALSTAVSAGYDEDVRLILCACDREKDELAEGEYYEDDNGGSAAVARSGGGGGLASARSMDELFPPVYLHDVVRLITWIASW